MNIQNYNTYTNEMKKSIFDKLFFIDKVDSELFVDYGCADGELIGLMNQLFPEHFYYGYDIDEKMIKLATNKFVSFSNIIFSNELDNDNEDKTLILSSVIHEIYSYGLNQSIKDFWKHVFKTNYSYIVIRDMIPFKTIDRVSCMNDVKNIYNKDRDTLNRVREFESCFGPITNNKNLIHFLLKYRYRDNWGREVKENYLPLYVEDILALIPNDYDIIYNESFTLPYIKNKVLDDFGIEIKDNTHLKLILRKK